MFNNDPNASTEELLEDIKKASLQTTNLNQMSLIMPPTSALFVKLSKETIKSTEENTAKQQKLIQSLSEQLIKISDEAKKSAESNIRLQRGLMIFTSIILVISIIQAVITLTQTIRVFKTITPTTITTSQPIELNNITTHPKIIYNGRI